MLLFFSSRGRHTRLVSDWSSDVCSSDLVTRRLDVRDNKEAPMFSRTSRRRVTVAALLVTLVLGAAAIQGAGAALQVGSVAREIGRASCRESVEVSVGAAILKDARYGQR